MIHYYSVFCVYPDHVWAHVPGADAGDISALSQLSLRGSASDRGMSPDVTCTSCVWGPSDNSGVDGLFVTTTPRAITAILFSIKVYPFLCHYSRNKDKEQQQYLCPRSISLIKPQRKIHFTHTFYTQAVFSSFLQFVFAI